jgi:hypothetical protein
MNNSLAAADAVAMAGSPFMGRRKLLMCCGCAINDECHTILILISMFQVLSHFCPTYLLIHHSSIINSPYFTQNSYQSQLC